MPKGQKLLGLELLRFVLAMGVVGYHYWFRGPLSGQIPREGFGSFVMVYGRFAVPVFFIVSGFVILASVRTRGAGEFAFARFVRLYPVLLTSATMTFIILAASHGTDCVQLLWLWFKAASFAGMVGGGAMIDDSYWSLAYELRFYVFVGALVWMRQIAHISLLMTALSVLGMAGYLAGIPKDVVEILLFPYMPMFTIGVLFYQLWARGGGPLTWAALLLNFILAGPGIHIDFALIDMLDGHRSGYWHGYAIVFVSVLLFQGALHVDVPAHWAGVARTFGAMSYPLYLIHQQAGYVVINAMVAAGLPVGVGQVIAVLFTLCFSYVVSVWIDRRASAVLGMWFQRRKA